MRKSLASVEKIFYLKTFEVRPGLNIMIFEDVLWLKIFIYTSFRLPDCSLQRVVIKYNDYRRLRFTITGYTPTRLANVARAFITRKKEHMKNVEKHKAGSNIANHAWSFDHKIDFKNCKIIDKANYRHRATLESWHTALTTNADNNSKHLPEQYRFLLKK